MKKLTGVSFVWNAIVQDYCIIESLESLYECCDSLSIVFGGTDGTEQLVLSWINSKRDKPIVHQIINEEEWSSQQGRTKLSHFSNMAIHNAKKILKPDYVFYLQADEVLHESSFDYVRLAMNYGEEAFMVSRINLWGSPYFHLNVPHNRKPVSTEIIRLSKPEYHCVDDAESIGDAPHCSLLFVEHIRIYHAGFVRDKHKHLEKIKHMQRDVFLMDYDKRVDECSDGFDPWKFGFTPKDIQKTAEPIPRFLEKWAEPRCQMVFNGYPDKAREFLEMIESRFMIPIQFHGVPESRIIELANQIINLD